MKTVLDASLFFIEYPLKGELFTTPGVVAELKDFRSKCRYEALLAAGLRVCEGSRQSLEKVRVAAESVGDAGKLSETDVGILALSLDIGGAILSDDFAVQNVALALGLTVQPAQQRKAKKRIWKFRCPGCGHIAEMDGECPVCGSQIKRTIK
jgi:UPF0271 protein